MSAVLKDAPRLAQMRDADLDQVLAIETEIYTHPWTLGNFADSLRAGYQCWTWRSGAEVIGYFILLVAAGEAHLLNLSIAAAHCGHSERHVDVIERGAVVRILVGLWRQL